MSNATVILVHGLWMTGSEMSLLKRRLRVHGLGAHQFRYRMLTKSLDHNRELLKSFIEKHNGGGNLHIVGHSLGGVLALQTLRAYPELPVETVICLGSPLVDSAAGRRVSGVAAGRAILGRTLPEAIFDEPLSGWSGPQKVGVIAGSRGFGLGNMVTIMPKPNDGVVTVAETRLAGIDDHLELPLGHTALILSAEVAKQCHWFMMHGQFKRR
jgi:pimeloyl-ACP methyl ester carboxylesterase